MGDILFRGQLQLNEDLADPLRRAPLDLQRLGKLILRDQPRPEEDLAEFFAPL